MHPAYLRERFGGLFVTRLSDGQEIVWRPLTVGEFVEYDRLIRERRYPLAYIHDEIFRKCVQNKFLVETLGELKAGIVETVSATILQCSGPSTLDELDQLLEFNRRLSSGVIHQMVGFIAWAFPAYKPEDIYAMDYETLMFRLAQAENKLARTGAISTPFTFNKPEEKEEKKERPKKPTEDLLTKFYEQEGFVDSRTGRTPKPISRLETKPKTPPASSTTKQTIISTDDIKEHQLAYVGHEMEDRYLLETTMVQQTSGIYEGYLDQLKKDGKIRFKTPEERKAEALARSEKYKKIIAKVDTIRSEEDRKLQETIVQKQAAKKERKKKVPGRRR